MTSETRSLTRDHFMMYACLSSARHGSLREASASFSTTTFRSRTLPLTPASGPVLFAARPFYRFGAVNRFSGYRASSVDKQDLARDVCARRRSK
jgi:hypothetical protein